MQITLKEAEDVVRYQSKRWGYAVAGGGEVGRSRVVSPAASSPSLAGHLAARDAEDLPVIAEHPADVRILC